MPQRLSKKLSLNECKQVIEQSFCMSRGKGSREIFSYLPSDLFFYVAIVYVITGIRAAVVANHFLPYTILSYRPNENVAVYCCGKLSLSDFKCLRLQWQMEIFEFMRQKKNSVHLFKLLLISKMCCDKHLDAQVCVVWRCDEFQ